MQLKKLNTNYMNKQEKKAIQEFLTHMSVKDYAKAEKAMQNAVEEKLKTKIRSEISSTSK